MQLSGCADLAILILGYGCVHATVVFSRLENTESMQTILVNGYVELAACEQIVSFTHPYYLWGWCAGHSTSEVCSALVCS